jgi:hypothetical protein
MLSSAEPVPTLKLCSHLFAGYTRCVKSRASRITAALILLTCIVCPVIDSFDTWDDALQTGNETEYTFVLLALCVGVTYSFARFIFKSVVVGFAAKAISAAGAPSPLVSPAYYRERFFLDGPSPPGLALRI